MDSDLNKYDLEQATREHETMTKEELEGIYERVWHLYYSWDHIETLIRRPAASNIVVSRLVSLIFEFYGSYRFERLHPLQSGLIRRKRRNERRPELPKESPLIYYPKRFWEILRTYIPGSWFLARLMLVWWKVHRDPNKKRLRTWPSRP